MVIGVAKEIKGNENRVALVPSGVELLVGNEHTVLVERNAGRSSGFSDDDYTAVGAEIIDNLEEMYIKAGMILKVKEPLPEELSLIRPGQIVFTFFHFAAS
ncbi:alanine dehydrogenase, partial [candidate division KSB1 bacterium]|nr:alanine dehydrogenase [candidate division KSB1 bacterium]